MPKPIKQAILRSASAQERATEEETDLRERFLTLLREQFRIKQGQSQPNANFEDRTFRTIYSSYQGHKEKTIARSFPKQRSVTPYNALLIILDREFLNRLPDYKRKSIEYKKAILPAFMSIFNFVEQVNKYIYEKSAEKPKELNKQQLIS